MLNEFIYYNEISLYANNVEILLYKGKLYNIIYKNTYI